MTSPDADLNRSLTENVTTLVDGGVEPLPVHLLVDYIEIAALSAMFLVGVATNRWAYRRLTTAPGDARPPPTPAATRHQTMMLVELDAGDTAGVSNKMRLTTSAISERLVRGRGSSTARRKRSVRRQMTSSQSRLQLCLLVSNLLVLFIYCPIKVFWLTTYQWLLGGLACKVAHFFFLFVFCLSSNVVASIALNRAVCIHRLLNADKRASAVLSASSAAVRTMQIGSVVLAVFVSLLQLAVFDVVTAHDAKGNVVFQQCVTIWDHYYLHALGLAPAASANRYLAALGVTANVYNAFHVIVIFWAPFATILVSYAYVVIKLLIYSMRPVSSLSTRAAAEHVRPSTQGVPAWRRRMRGRMCRTAGTIVLCYVLFWLPYNAICAVGLLVPALRPALSDHTYWLQCLIVLNSVVNPLLYDFK